MGTVTTLAGGAQIGRTAAPAPIFAENVIDIEAWVTAEGGALVAGDIIEAISVPAEHIVLTAGIEVVSPLVGESADTRFLLGVVGGDVDAFVASWDATAAAAGAYAPATQTGQVMFGAADTIDLELDAATTGPTAGKLRVWALMVPVSGRILADEVDRDQLA
jgi:hypothetical protein